MGKMFDESKNPPVRGVVDLVIRRFRLFAWMSCVLALYGVGAITVALSIAPAVALLETWLPWSAALPYYLRWPALGLGFARTASLNDSPRFIDALEEAVRDRLEE